MEVGGWVQVSLGIFFLNHPKIALNKFSKLDKNCAFCGKSMKLGTHAHYTKTSKFSYSAKPDYTWGGCGGHFPKCPLSLKLIGTEPSISTLFIRFVGRKFQKKYCRYNHAVVSAILEAISKVILLSQKLRGA